MSFLLVENLYENSETQWSFPSIKANTNLTNWANLKQYDE